MRLRSPHDFPFSYAFELVDAVEQASCSKGCLLAVPVDGTGPGGACGYLAGAFADEPVPFERKGRGVRCLARQPLPEPDPEPTECHGQVDLFGGAA